jgi:hypothetical protein
MNASEKTRPPGRTWQLGQSGNLSGRPRGCATFEKASGNVDVYAEELHARRPRRVFPKEALGMTVTEEFERRDTPYSNP